MPETRSSLGGHLLIVWTAIAVEPPCPPSLQMRLMIFEEHTGIVMIGKCRLCLRDGVGLQRSHLLSAAVYRILRDDQLARNPNPVIITPKGRMQSNQQQWAHLLCRCCEALLSREGEDWIFRHGMKRDGSFPLAEMLRRSRPSVGTLGEHTRLYEAALIPEINAAAITHFAIGTFWKASVYGWNTDGSIPVNLGGYGDRFRHFLLGEAKFPTDAVLAVLVREGGPIDRLTHTPAGSVGPEISTYQFPIPGFSFVLTIGKNISERISRYCFVRGAGRPIVITVATEQFLFQQAQRPIERAQRPEVRAHGRLRS
jgi:hypothetical protein